MGHQNILTLVDYFETMNNRMFCLWDSLSERMNGVLIRFGIQYTWSLISPWVESCSTASAVKAVTTNPMLQT